MRARGDRTQLGASARLRRVPDVAPVPQPIRVPLASERSTAEVAGTWSWHDPRMGDWAELTLHAAGGFTLKGGVPFAVFRRSEEGSEKAPRN